MAAPDEHDDHYPYADAVACALAAVLLLFVAAIVNQGIGEQTVPARDTFVVTLKYDGTPELPAASVELNAKQLVKFLPGDPKAEKKGCRAQPAEDVFPGFGILPVPTEDKREVRFHTQEGTEPSMQIVLDSFPRPVWKATIRVRSEQAAKQLALVWRFDKAPNCPRSLHVRHTNNETSPKRPATEAVFTDFRGDPVTVIIETSRQGVSIRREETP